MPKKLQQRQGVELGEVRYDGDDVMAQTIPETDGEGVLVHDNDGQYVGIGERHLSTVLAVKGYSEQDFTATSITVEKHPNDVVTITNSRGDEIVIEDASEFHETVW